MLTRTLALAFLAGLTTSASVHACPPGETPSQSLQASVYGADRRVVVACDTAALRARGYEGLNELLARYDSSKDPSLLPAINEVAGQYDASWARLYWHTDLASAQTVAKREGKPILYLRMLGKLTDEYSCANSRFFRSALYANAEVSSLLRDKLVLVWESERPVPVATIDMGDGRVLKRTLTGNSIHYVLDAEGRVVDAIPGLYGPGQFAKVLREAEPLAKKHDAERYAQHAARITTELGAAARAMMAENVTSRANASAGNAAKAGRRAMGKAMVELSMVDAIAPQPPEPQAVIEARMWEKASRSYASLSMLDQRSAEMIRSQNPGELSSNEALGRTIEQFQRLIAIDTARGELQFRREILSWMAGSSKPIALADLNARVYRELFLTPATDPWLGLVGENVYSGLRDDGQVIADRSGVQSAQR